MGKSITWQELISQLVQHGISLHEQLPVPAAWNYNTPPPRYLENADRSLFMAVCVDKMEEHVTWSNLRSICDMFDLDHAEFGLDIH